MRFLNQPFRVLYAELFYFPMKRRKQKQEKSLTEKSPPDRKKTQHKRWRFACSPHWIVYDMRASKWKLKMFVKYIRTYTLSRAKELKIIKITCNGKKTIVANRNFAGPPADNLILLGKNTEEKKKKQIQTFQISWTGQRDRKKQKQNRPEKNPTNKKKNCLIRREISIPS